MNLAVAFNSIADFCSRVFDIVNDQLPVIRPTNKYSTCNNQEAIDTCSMQAISWGE
jgi:hypothetical protein